jgi:hypothetical protein
MLTAIEMKWNIEYYSSSGPVDRIVSNGARPVCSPVTVRSPIEQRVEADYLLVAVVSKGYPHVGLYIAVSFSSRVGDLDLVQGVSSVADSLK